MTAKHTKVSTMEKDHISNMLEDMIHEILDRVTMQDVARTISVSKAMKGFCVSFPIMNLDQQDFGCLRCARFKSFIRNKVRSMIQEQQCLVIFKFRLCLDLKYVRKAFRDIQKCVRLVTKTKLIKEFDFQVMNNDVFLGDYWDKLFGYIYNAESLTQLRLSSLPIVHPSGNIKFSKLQILSLEDVRINQESVIGQFITSCPMITEIRLVRCDGLKHLRACELGHLKRLEVGFCPSLESVEIQARRLEKLVLSEIKRTRFDEFYLGLSIDSLTCETLRELTLCNSSIRGITFSCMFSRCSNVESLILDRCVHFYKITIRSQKLRRLVVRRCFDLVMTEIEAPNLTSFSFCTFLPPLRYQEEPSLSSKLQYCEEISRLQDSMLDFTQTLYTQNMWISLWCDKFKDSADQKMVIYPKFGRHDVVVLEDWSSIAELMTKISEAAGRTIVTTMSFIDLADYVFGDTGKELKKVLAISSNDGSKLYEILLKKLKISCERGSSMVLAKKELSTFSSSTNWGSFSVESIIDNFFYKAPVEAGKTITLKATWLSVTPKTEVLKRKPCDQNY